VQEDMGMLYSVDSRVGELVTLVVICSGVLVYMFVAQMWKFSYELRDQEMCGWTVSADKTSLLW